MLHTTMPASPIALALPAACTGATQSLMIIALPTILALSELQVGQLTPVLGLAALGYLVGGYTWPRRAARGGRRRLLGRLLFAATVSQTLFVAALLAGAHGLLGTAALATALFAARLAYALTASGIFPTVQAWLLSEHPAPARHAALTRMSAAVNTGRVLVPLVTAALAMLWPGSALGLLVVLPLAAQLLLPHEQARLPAVPLPAPMRRLPEAAVVVPAALAHMSLGLAEFIIGPYLTAEWGIPLDRSPAYTALLLAGLAACMVTTQLASLRLRPEPGTLLTGAPLGMALGASLAVAWPPALPVGLAVMAVAFALLVPALAAGAAAGRDMHTQASASADLYTARILGHLLGVTAAGPFFELAPRLPLGAAAAIALIVVPSGIALRRTLAVSA